MLSGKYQKIRHCDVQPPNDDIWRNHLIIVGVHLGNVAGNGVDWLKAVVAPWGGCEKCPFGILFCFHLWHWWNFNDTQRMLPKRIFSKQFKFVEDGKCWHVLSATRHPSVSIYLCWFCFFFHHEKEQMLKWRCKFLFFLRFLYLFCQSDTNVRFFRFRSESFHFVRLTMKFNWHHWNCLKSETKRRDINRQKRNVMFKHSGRLG